MSEIKSSVSLSIDLMSRDQSDHATNYAPPSDDLNTQTNTRLTIKINNTCKNS